MIASYSVFNSAGQHGESSERVLVWKAGWLPGSETFVRNQIAAMSRWRPTAVGILQVASAISSDEDLIAFGSGAMDRVRRRLFLELRRSVVVQNMIDDVAPRLIHSHFASDASLIHPLAKKNGLPHVVTVHGHDVTALSGLRQREIRRRIDVLRQSERVLAVSNYIADQVKDFAGPECKIEVHHIGVPELSATTNKARVVDAVFVGRLTEQKGVLDAIRSLGIVQDRIGRIIRVAIIGDGPLRREVEEEAHRAAMDVTIMGLIPPQQVRSVLESARLLVAPSKVGPSGEREGFGMVFLEASRAGIPVVSYDSGGVVEAVLDGETGLLAPEGDIAALADRIEVLLVDSKLAAKMGEAGRTRVVEKFNVVEQTKVLEEIYDSCL